MTFDWDPGSTYLALPPYFDNMPKEPGPLADISGARELAIFGDSITTDHISPAGSIKKESPAGEYLDRASGAAAAISTPTARGAATTRDDARHLRQYPHQERDGAGRRGRHDQASCPTAR